MRRVIIIILILTAIPLYVWDFYLFTAGHFKHGKREKVQVVSNDVRQSTILVGDVHFVEKGRSPFTPNKELSKPLALKTDKKKPVQPTTPVTPPPISINGIMWNENNPVAIINLSDGSSTVAKKGQVLAGGIVVKNIEKNQVEVEFNGKSFWLKK